jgi:hypothetical protein
MNFRRGFFRFWILASIVWFISFGFGEADNLSEAIDYWRGTATVQISAGDSKINFPVSATFDEVEGAIQQGVADGKITFVPDIARVKRNIQRMKDQNAPEKDIDEYLASEGTTSGELRIADEKPPSTLSKGAVKDFILERVRLRIKANAVINRIGIILLIPLLVLVFGWAVAWMLRGFRSA